MKDLESRIGGRIARAGERLKQKQPGLAHATSAASSNTAQILFSSGTQETYRSANTVATGSVFDRHSNAFVVSGTRYAKLYDHNERLSYPQPSCSSYDTSVLSSFSCCFSSAPSQCSAPTAKKRCSTFPARTSSTKGKSMVNSTAPCAPWISWPRLRRASSSASVTESKSE